jgi:hypothetical protein
MSLAFCESEDAKSAHVGHLGIEGHLLRTLDAFSMAVRRALCSAA